MKLPDMLHKKITKTQSMMKEAKENEKRGGDSKLHRSLVKKLNQHETELSEFAAKEPQNEETKESEGSTELGPGSNSDDIGALSSPDKNVPILPTAIPFPFPPPPPHTPIENQTKRRNVRGSKRQSDVPLSDTLGSPAAKPNLLQRKIEKINKLLVELEREHGHKSRENKEYKRLSKKREGYKKNLEEFENRMKLQAMDATLIRSATQGVMTSPVSKPTQYIKMARQSPLPATKKKEIDNAPSVPKKKRGKKKVKRQKTNRVSATRIQELDKEFKPTAHPKSPAAQELIRGEIKRNFIFRKLNDNSVNDLIKAFKPTPVYAPGDNIIEQGEFIEPIYFYIIGSGSVDYEMNGETVGGAEVGASFGEQGLLYSWPRKNTVTASSETMLFRIDQVTFRYVLQNQTKFKQVWMQATQKIMVMNRLMGAGAMRQLMQPDDDDDDDVVINPAVKSEKRTAENLKLKYNQDEHTGGMMGEMSSRRQSMRTSFHGGDVRLEDFDREAVLGEGQFGEVWKVKPKIEALKDQDFALKIQAKEGKMRQSNAGMTITVAQAIERECEVLSQFCHPFICEFVHKFEDDKNIYLVMGVIRGVELWNVIHRESDDGEWNSGMPESNARFYGLIIADTLRYMHCRKICYRDLKPENVMIDETGYPVFVDFGFAKHIPEGQTFTFCGTPNYTAPEIIGNQGHGYAVDWWALGIVIYEMICGENPFYYDGISDMTLLKDISYAEPEPLGDEYSTEVKDLTSRLLIKDPEKRLGSKEILSHPWFSGIDLGQAREKLVEAPFLPPVSDGCDDG